VSEKEVRRRDKEKEKEVRRKDEVGTKEEEERTMLRKERGIILFLLFLNAQNFESLTHHPLFLL